MNETVRATETSTKDCWQLDFGFHFGICMEKEKNTSLIGTIAYTDTQLQWHTWIPIKLKQYWHWYLNNIVGLFTFHFQEVNLLNLTSQKLIKLHTLIKLYVHKLHMYIKNTTSWIINEIDNDIYIYILWL